MTKKYTLKNIETGEIVKWTLQEILAELNRDRSDEWSNYNKLDWREGLKEWTEFELIE